MKKQKVTAGTSPKAKNLSARLAAVQAVYQALHNGQSMQSVLEEYIAHHKIPPSEGEVMVQPDGALLKKILLGIGERREDLDVMVAGSFKKQGQVVEPLLHSILLCGAYELIGNTEVDAPIIINDYLNVTHSFYEHGEVALVNGILDSISKTVRAQA